MRLELLVVISHAGFRLKFARELTKAVVKAGAEAGIVFLGNSVFDIRQRVSPSLDDLRGVKLMAHRMSMTERGISQSEIADRISVIDDAALLDLLMMSEKSLCI